MEQSNFQTSTPKKRKDDCEDCAAQSGATSRPAQLAFTST